MRSSIDLRVPLALTLAWVVLASCQCENPSPDTASGYCAELARLRCDHRVKCGTAREEDRAVCERAYRHSWPCEALEARVEEGFAHFDSDAAQRCLSYARDAGDDCSYADVLIHPDSLSALVTFGGTPACGEEDPVVGAAGPPATPAPPACGGEATPLSEHGSQCRVDADCVSNDDVCGGTGCGRTCQAGGVLNGPCTRHHGCNAGLFCDFTADKCEPGQPLGATCGWDAQCDPTVGICDFQTTTCVAFGAEGDPCPCAPGLLCRLGVNSPPVCIHRPQEGEHCESQFECEKPLLCLSQVCFRPLPEGATCKWDNQCAGGLFCLNHACSPRLKEGAACTGASEFCECVGGLSCDEVLGTCEAFISVGEGQPCTALSSAPRWTPSGTRGCDDEHRCVGAAPATDGGVGTFGACERKQLGDPCRGEFDCPHQSYCAIESDAGGGTCVAATPGSPCVVDAHCLPEHFCRSDYRCGPPLGAGEACNFANPHCADGLRCEYRDPAFLCLAPPAAGDPCEDATHSTCDGFGFDCIDHLCIAAGGPGKPCLRTGQCLVGACSNGTCGDAREDGAACATDLECASGWCDHGACQPAECRR